MESFVSFCKVVIHCIFPSDYVELQNRIIHPDLAWYAERGKQRGELDVCSTSAENKGHCLEIYTWR